MSRHDEEAGMGCLMIIIIAFAIGLGCASCISDERQSQRDHEFRMEQLRIKQEQKK